MSQKIIRKQSLLSKIQSYPIDLLIYINETRLSIEWDNYSQSLALPVGVALLALSLVSTEVISYYNMVHSRSENILFQTDYHQYERMKARLVEMDYSRISEMTYTFIYLIRVVSYGLFVLSVVHAYFLMTSVRRYNLMYCSEQPTGSIARKLTLGDASIGVWIMGKLKSYWFGSDVLVGENEDGEINLVQKEVYQLSVWVPSKFSLYIAVSFNPLNSLILKMCVDNSSAFRLSTVVTAVTITLYVMCASFLNLLNDKQILYQEMFNEYNNKFVKPKTSTLKKDVLIDSTKGPLFSTVLTESNSHLFNRSKVFVTHDINGNRRNMYESGGSSDGSSSGKAAEVFPRSQTYKQIQYYNNIHSDGSSLLKQEVDELRRKNTRLAKQVDFLKNLQEGKEEENGDDDFRKMISSSTPFRSSQSNFTPKAKRHDLSAVYSSRSRLNSPSKTIPETSDRTRLENFSRSRIHSPSRTRLESPTRSKLESPLRTRFESPSRHGRDYQGNSPSRILSRTPSPIKPVHRSSSPIKDSNRLTSSAVPMLRSPSPRKFETRSPNQSDLRSFDDRSSMRSSFRSPSPSKPRWS